MQRASCNGLNDLYRNERKGDKMSEQDEIRKLRAELAVMKADRAERDLAAEVARKQRKLDEEKEQRLKAAEEYGFLNPADAVQFLQYAENFNYELGLLAKSGRLPMRNDHEKQQPPRIRM